MLKKLERRLGPYAIPNLVLYLVVGQVVLYLVAMTNRDLIEEMVLVPQLVLDGQIWRLATFVFMPESFGLFFVFEIYLLWLFGSALESHWGAFRFNVYVGLAFALSIAAAFAFPFSVASNIYALATILFAFAVVNPNFELRMMFVLPMKIKWVAAIFWAAFAYEVVTRDWPRRALILASVANFILFFGRDILTNLKNSERARKNKKEWERKNRSDD